MSKTNKVKLHKEWLLSGAGILAAVTIAQSARAQSQPTDRLLDALVKKGYLTQDEARDIKSEESTNTLPVADTSKWKLSPGIKSIELFGDFRLRYEYRSAEAPNAETLTRERYRYAVRLGIRGDVLDNFYYGLRLETSTSNPRSSWVTFGDSTGGVPNQGPFSKNSAAIAIGQVYIGWRPEQWLDLSVGKMPNPLFSTPMIWDPDLNPEGASETVKYSTGNVNLYATLGQFLYQDTDPDHPAPGIYGIGGNTSDLFMLAWQLGATYNFDTNMYFKAAPTMYNYSGHGQTATLKPAVGSVPFLGFANNFVGQGTAADSNFPANNTTTGANGFAFNQTGINDLLVFDLPWEFVFPIGRFDGKIFGDFAYNIEGDQRAEVAAATAAAMGSPFPKQTGQNKAYQVGFAFGHTPRLLPINAPTTSAVVPKGSWEARVYWQHTEQYSVDVNLIDSDYFEGRANLEGFYSAFTYNITGNIIGAVRYGYANRINKNLGTGGSNADLPWINPINNYQIMQFDLTYKF